MTTWGKLLLAACGCLAFFLLPLAVHLDGLAHADCASEHVAHDHGAADTGDCHDSMCPCHQVLTALLSVHHPVAAALASSDLPLPSAETGPEGIPVPIERPPSIS